MVSAALDQLLDVVCTPGEDATAPVPFDSIFSFYGFFLEFLGQFAAVSCGNEPFARYLWLFLRADLRPEYRAEARASAEHSLGQVPDEF